jgi:hypothetical protein
MRPEARNDCAAEDQQQFNRLTEASESTVSRRLESAVRSLELHC